MELGPAGGILLLFLMFGVPYMGYLLIAEFRDRNKWFINGHGMLKVGLSVPVPITTPVGVIWVTCTELGGSKKKPPVFVAHSGYPRPGLATGRPYYAHGAAYPNPQDAVMDYLREIPFRSRSEEKCELARQAIEVLTLDQDHIRLP